MRKSARLVSGFAFCGPACAVFLGLTSCSATTPAPANTPEGYDPMTWAKAWRLHHNAFVADTHSDTTSLILDQDFDMGKRSTTGHMDLPRIEEGGLDCQIYSIYVSKDYFGDEDMSDPQKLAASKPNASARRALDMMDGFFRTVEKYPNRMEACFSVADIRRTVAKGKHAALMGIEGGHAIEADLKLLRMFHRAGIRYMTLTHTNHNHFADSCAPVRPRWAGLNRLGEKVVLEMNRLGMMVDLSHVSDATFYHVLRVTRAPVILSHSSTRALCGNLRNVTDDMLRQLKKNNGIIQINFNCGFLDANYGVRRQAWRMKTETRVRAIKRRFDEDTDEYKQAMLTAQKQFPEPERPKIDVLIDHFMHAIEIAGEDHVGLGSDFDGVPCVPQGMDDVTYLPHIAYHLLRRGVREEVVRKVLGENLLRVFSEVERVARYLALGGEQPHRNDPATDFGPGLSREK